MGDQKTWFLYLIQCGNDSLYCGITTDVERRFEEHQSQGPKSAKYLRGRLPLRLVYREEVGDRSQATKRELTVKRLSKQQKLDLISPKKIS